MFRLTALLFATLFTLARPALAIDPGAVVLTVSGAVAQERQFDLESLQALGSEVVETATIWTEGEQRFVGVPLVRLVEKLGVSGQILHAVAVNDYAVDIPVSDAVPNGPIIAWERNGKPMSVRDKGPLWIVYPYDSEPIYQSEVIYSRSIWQLDRLVVKP